MLPADLLATWIEHWPVFAHYQDDPGVRSIVVSYTTNILLNVLTALIVFRLLQQFGFSVKESAVGVLALLFCTTHLHYTQNMTENNYIMLLTLTGFSYQYEWLQTGNRSALLGGSSALGLNLLTRLPTGLDIIAVGIFLLLTLLFDRTAGRPSWRRLLDYCKVVAPIYLFFLSLDRLYQFYRYGSFTNTYVTIFAREYHQLDPSLPPDFPWSTPLHTGVLGALFTPEKSIFLFDPLLAITIVLLLLLWKRLAPVLRAYALATLLLLLAYTCFYARYAYWSGDFAWGDRYVSTSVELAALLAVPLLVRYRAALGKTLTGAALALVAVSLIVQIASLVFWVPLEIYQMETLGHPTFVIALRFKNIAAFAFGKMDAWGLITPAMSEDPWDNVHITTWNFLPFLLQRVGAVPQWVVTLTRAIWLVAIAALVVVLQRLRNTVRTRT
jgi:hypothetical protein